MSDIKYLYLLDANVFIEASNRYYSFELCPGFWRAVERDYQNGRLLSISKIKDEIAKVDNELAAWAKQTILKQFFPSIKDANVIAKYGEIISWVYSNDQFLAYAKADFASGADGWLIAFACVNDIDIITHEKFEPNARKKVHIPNVCNQFGVKTHNTFEMLTQLNIVFVLEE